MEIRPLEPHKDAPEIAEIYKWYVENTTATFETVPPTPEVMEERLHAIASDYPCYVCEESGRVVGYCYVHLWKTFAAYSLTLETTIYLRPGMEGHGIGLTLMEHLIRECRERGFVSLIACITAENDGSRRFHERLGFSQVSDFKRVGYKFGRYLDVTDYQLQL